MPSIHAILFVALGGVLAADPRDDPAQDRPAIEDPFLAPADYRAPAPAPRQPRPAGGGGSPPTVRLAQPPLPGDFGQTTGRETGTTGTGTIDSGGNGEAEPSGARLSSGNPPASSQWDGAVGTPAENTPDRGTNTSIQTVGWETPAAPAADGRNGKRSIALPPPSGNGDLLPHVMPAVEWPVVAGSLGGVVGLFLIVTWVLRRGRPRVGGLLPREVVEVLGRAPLADRRQMQLLRLGNKLVLIAVSPAGTDTLAEITDPVEVDRLTGYCYQGHPNSSTVAFHKVFKSLETAPKHKATRAGQRVEFADLERLGYGDSPTGEADHGR